MEQLKAMKEQLIGVVQSQLTNIQNVDAKELGEVVDMIKDLADTMKLCEEEKYYKTITEAMEKQDKEKPERHYYTPMYIHYPPMSSDYHEDRDMDRHMGRMYYGGRTDPNMYRDNEYENDETHMYSGHGRGQARDSRGRFMYGGQRGNSDNNNSSGNSGGNSGGTSYYTEREVPIEMRDTREGRSGMSRRTYMESKEMHKDKTVKIKELENYMKELGEDIVDMIKDASPEERQILEKKITALASKVASLPNA